MSDKRLKLKSGQMSGEELSRLYQKIKQPQNKGEEKNLSFNLQTFPKQELVRVYSIE